MIHINHFCAILYKDRVYTIGKEKLYYLSLPKKLSFLGTWAIMSSIWPEITQRYIS